MLRNFERPRSRRLIPFCFHRIFFFGALTLVCVPGAEANNPLPSPSETPRTPPPGYAELGYDPAAISLTTTLGYDDLGFDPSAIEVVESPGYEDLGYDPSAIEVVPSPSPTPSPSSESESTSSDELCALIRKSQRFDVSVTYVEPNGTIVTKKRVFYGTTGRDWVAELRFELVARGDAVRTTEWLINGVKQPLQSEWIMSGAGEPIEITLPFFPPDDECEKV